MTRTAAAMPVAVFCVLATWSLVRKISLAALSTCIPVITVTSRRSRAQRDLAARPAIAADRERGAGDHDIGPVLGDKVDDRVDRAGLLAGVVVAAVHRGDDLP